MEKSAPIDRAEDGRVKLKTISIEYGRVVNLGSFNSLRATCTLGAELEDGEDADAALAALWDKARESVRGQVHRLLDRKGQQTAVAGGEAEESPHNGADASDDEPHAEPGR